ncbi:MAG: protein phosphatase CheZ [Xanthomonadaceae bacterium]|nr:protein phosphatase CheZ [Xanthomonadaceae bacterium]
MNQNALPSSASDHVPERLRDLLQSRDPEQIEQAIAAMLREREQSLFIALGQLARELHESVKNVATALQPEGGGAPGMPEARRRLDEALDMSERAAHQSLDIGDRLLQGADALERSARDVAGAPASASLAAVALQFAGTCRDDVRALREAQSWQDLTGQRMKQVSQFLARIEGSVLDLVRLAGSLGASQAKASDGATVTAIATASTQDEVDRLLAEFGF